MEFTYKIGSCADSDLYNSLKKDITDLYSDQILEDEKRYADGSRKAVYRSSSGEICIELNCENNETLVSSDIRLDAIASKYVSNVKHDRKNDLRQAFIDWIFSKALIKYILIPIALMIIYGLITGQLWDSLGFPLLIGKELLDLAVGYGIGMLYIPAAAWTVYFSEKENDDMYRVPAASFIIVTFIQTLICFFDSKIFFYSFAGILSYGRGHILYGFIKSVYILPMIYIAFVPVMAVCDFADSIHFSMFNRMSSKKNRVILWAAAVGIMLLFLIGYCAVGKLRYDREIRNAWEDFEIRLNREQQNYEYLYNKYYDDLRAAADYSKEHNYYDWKYCPDDECEELWRRLHEDNEILLNSISPAGDDSVEITVMYDNGSYIMDFSGNSVSFKGDYYSITKENAEGEEKYA